jgi:hypothetical protein
MNNEKMKTWLSIDHCPKHGYYAVSVNDENGGTRLTKPKCCGSWTEVKRFEVGPRQLKSMVDELEFYAESAEEP